MTVKAKDERMLYRRNAIALLGPKIRALREKLGLRQADFGDACGVSAVQVSRWEKKHDLPSTKALLTIAGLAPEEDQEWWLEQAGIEGAKALPPVPGMRPIPLLRDSLAAGTPRAVDEREIERVLSIPDTWLPKGGEIYAVRVSGDSMAPIIGHGFTVMIDVSQRDPQKLVEKMVAARDGDGITVKWLRKDGDVFLLVPQYTSLAHPVKILRLNEGWGIVGLVVKWIGEPPAPPRRR